MALDFRLPLAINQAGAGSTTGGYLDLMSGTSVQATNQGGTDLLGPAGVRHYGIPLAAFIKVTGSSGTPVGVFTLSQCDDISGTNLTTIGTASVAADGEYQIPLVGVTKRFLRLDYAKTTGTIPYSAYIGTA